MFTLDAITAVGPTPLTPVPTTDVRAAEGRLWLSFPADYAEYMARFGQGEFSGYVRIYTPRRVEAELAEWRRDRDRYWGYAASAEPLPKARAVECVPIGDTIDADLIAFHPARPDRLYVLPRHRHAVSEVAGGLLAALDWIATSGTIVQRFSERTFEPFGDWPATAEGIGPPADPAGQALSDLVHLGQSWAARHAARAASVREMQPHVGPGKRAVLAYESVNLDGRSTLTPGYAIAWQIIDEVTGGELGLFKCFIGTSGVRSTGFEPTGPELQRIAAILRSRGR